MVKNNQICEGVADPKEHLIRLFNHEMQISMPELIVPSFITKKDPIAHNIVAYLVRFTFLFKERL